MFLLLCQIEGLCTRPDQDNGLVRSKQHSHNKHFHSISTTTGSQQRLQPAKYSGALNNTVNMLWPLQYCKVGMRDWWTGQL